MSASVISTVDGSARQLDTGRQADEVVSAEEIADAPKLARLLTRMLGETARIQRRWQPSYIDFTDIVTTGGDIAPSRFTLTHRFGGEVRFWIVDLTKPVGALSSLLSRVETSDENNLVLDAFFAATITVRVEEVG